MHRRSEVLCAVSFSNSIMDNQSNLYFVIFCPPLSSDAGNLALTLVWESGEMCKSEGGRACVLGAITSGSEYLAKDE